MSIENVKAPDRDKLLYKNLFGECSSDVSFERIAEGITASLRNAERLLSDVRLLLEQERFASARFLLTTAREELAKSYILVDMCRLDFEKHKDLLRKLCRAFYNHIDKHAYIAVQNYPNISSMDHARGIWETEVQRWWPSSGPEDGVPDLPHDTYFDRELPLYIDYSDYDQQWLIPTDSYQRLLFKDFAGVTLITIPEKLTQSWQEADSIGLYSPASLKILNDVFKKHFIQIHNSREDIIEIHLLVAIILRDKLGISEDSFMKSPLIQFPLYPFLTK